MQNWRERISVNPAVGHGRACVRGTRVLVSVIVDNVAAGVPREEILRNYATLTDPDFDAALAYTAELTREGTVDLPLEIKAGSSKSTRIFQQSTRRSRQALHTLQSQNERFGVLCCQKSST